MIIEISDRFASRVLKVLTEMGVAVCMRSDDEATWMGDSILEALFEISEELYDSQEVAGELAYEMVKDIEIRLFRGNDRELMKLDRMRRSYFSSYVRSVIETKLEGKA